MRTWKHSDGMILDWQLSWKKSLNAKCLYWCYSDAWFLLSVISMIFHLLHLTLPPLHSMLLPLKSISTSTFPPCYSTSTCLLINLSFSLPFNAILLALFPFRDMSHSLPLTHLSIISVIACYHYLVLTFWHTYSAFPPLAILLFPSASFPFSIPPPPTVYKHSPSHYVLQSEYWLESTRISTWVLIYSIHLVSLLCPPEIQGHARIKGHST